MPPRPDCRQRAGSAGRWPGGHRLGQLRRGLGRQELGMVLLEFGLDADRVTGSTSPTVRPGDLVDHLAERPDHAGCRRRTRRRDGLLPMARSARRGGPVEGSRSCRGVPRGALDAGGARARGRDGPALHIVSPRTQNKALVRLVVPSPQPPCLTRRYPCYSSGRQPDSRFSRCRRSRRADQRQIGGPRREILSGYRADPGVAMAELDYQLAARKVPLPHRPPAHGWRSRGGSRLDLPTLCGAAA